MEDKLQTTEQPKKDGGSSAMKQFMLSLLATTISIALTFGTSAIIENNKKKSEKREIVMMVMYDLYTSLKMVQQADSNLFELLKLQRDIAEDTTLYERKKYDFIRLMPKVEYTNTTEKIFSSSIETINTVGNVLFTENVAEFYYSRNLYKQSVSDSVFTIYLKKDINILKNLKDALQVELTGHILLSQSIYSEMKNRYEECKLLMNVTDKEIEVYRKKKRLIEKNMTDSLLQNNSRTEEVMQVSKEIEEGMKKHH
ncbi:MAG: hypothetical protein II415_09485, partial [Bacteroidaceae bacterium]|nr:hypothetical protein [Bacteroidaceae bacterium]